MHKHHHPFQSLVQIRKRSLSSMMNSNTKSPRRKLRISCRHGSPCSTIVLFSLATLFTVTIDPLLAEGSKLEANHGENVTLAFPMDKAEEADRLRIIFEEETTKNMSLVAQKCVPHEGCDNVDTPGVSLIFGKGCLSVIIQKVDISRSGLYKAQTFFGKDVFEVIATLAVNKAPVSSTISPPHSSSSPTPAHSSQTHRRYAVITAVAIFIFIICISCFCRQRKVAVKNVKMLNESPDPASPQKELESVA